MDLGREIEKRIVASIDLSKYEKQIQAAVDYYFESESFQDYVADILNEEGVAEEIGKNIAKKVISTINTSLTISLKGK